MPGALDRGTLVGVDNYFRVTSICECIGAQSLSSRYLLNPVVLTMYCCDKCLNPALFKRYSNDSCLNPMVFKLYRRNKVLNPSVSNIYRNDSFLSSMIQ